MTGVLNVPSQAILVTTAPVHSIITVKTLGILPRTAQTGSPHQKHHITMTGCTPNPIGTDPSHSTTDTVKEDTLTSQDHTANTTMADTPATIRGTHPTPPATTVATCDTHQLTNTLGNTLSGTHCTSTTVTFLRHATSPTRVTLETILQTEANQVQDTLLILPVDHTLGWHQSHIHEEQLLISHHQKKVTIQDLQLDASSESDNYSDPLNY